MERDLKPKIICYAETIRIFLKYIIMLMTFEASRRSKQVMMRPYKINVVRSLNITNIHEICIFIMFLREEMRKKFSSSFVESLVTCSNSCSILQEDHMKPKNESFLICPQITKYVSLLPHTTSFMVLNVKINATAY